MRKKVSILRLSHRVIRDKRITTHLALVCRAFGAMCMYYTGDRDTDMENNIRKVNETWGNSFNIKYISDPHEFVKNWRKRGGTVIHLTMYGEPLIDTIGTIKKLNDLLLIVGSEKVDAYYFKISDYNISITNQPHSEIAAVAVFLDYYYGGAEFRFKYKDPRLRIVPSKRRKIIEIVKNKDFNISVNK